MKAIYKEEGYYINIYFGSIPSDRTRQLMKACGWKWYNPGACWSNKRNSENLEFAKLLCDKLNKDSSEQLSKHASSKYIDEKTILVINKAYSCDKHSNAIELTAKGRICDRKGNLIYCIFPIAYCNKCKKYFLKEDTFKKIRKRGVLLCKVLYADEYDDYDNAGVYNANNQYWYLKSPLRIMGYNTGALENLSEAQRHVILEIVIEKRIMTRNQVLSHLQFFIDSHPHNDEASERWHADMEYISRYKLMSSKKVPLNSGVITISQD